MFVVRYRRVCAPRSGISLRPEIRSCQYRSYYELFAVRPNRGRTRARPRVDSRLAARRRGMV
jgi:hypothetical protein